MNFNTKKFKSNIPEIEVFRHLRVSAPLTTRELAKLLGCHWTAITHWELGRHKMSEKRRQQYMKLFRITEEELKEYRTGVKPVPINYKSECMMLVDRMSVQKLQTLYPILVSFLK